MPETVVVTGVGVVTVIGTGREAFWRNLLAGRNGVSEVTSFDTSAYKTRRGAEIKDFTPAPYFRALDASRVGRASQLAVAAARLALEDAEWSEEEADRERAGTAVGTTSGEPLEVERFNDLHVRGDLGRVGPELAQRYPCHVIAGHVATELGFGGENVMIPAACAAGNYAIAHAADVVARGGADVMVAGGSDAFSRITFTGFSQLGAIAPERCQPFDRNRRGMVPGEGAGMLVLEPRARAEARGARIYAEVAGYGLSCDAHHMTGAHPRGEGAVRAMTRALARSGLRPDEVGYISAHGTGTPSNDRTETMAIKQVFGEAAYRIPVSSIKSMLGHAMGAASAIEAVACVLAIRHGEVPPTINLETPDPECDLDYVPNTARACEVRVAMNNAYAFGGNNASLVLRRHPWN
jgi:3-oxoacyl-[acyl-carrier-protein] synthase II